MSKLSRSRPVLWFFIVASFLIAGCSAKSEAVAAQTAAKPDATTSAAPPAPGDSYTPKRGETSTSVARKFLSQSSLMTVAELDEAIRKANNLRGTALPAGKVIIIPSLENPVVEKSRPIAKDSDIRAIYLTGTMAGSHDGMAKVRRWKELGGNAVVFDMKDSDGTVNVPFDHPLAPRRSRPITNLPKYVRWLHSMDLHVIARIALFRDDNIAQHHSELAVHSRATGQPWQENGKLVWADPSNPQVQDYNLALAKHVAASGVDEIQFDYVRFPAEGNQKDALFYFESHNGESHKAADGTPLERKHVIANFLERAYNHLHAQGVLLSLDVFGVMAWQRNVDLAHTGQDIVLMAKHCDVLSPMIYPSHFFGMDNIASPGDAPEHFISTSMDRFRLITNGSGVTLRPWLQAFGWRTKTYSPEYIKVQALASKNHGGIGFLLWNARNDYSKPYAAMPEMTAAAERYFGKAELPPIEAKAVAQHAAQKVAVKTPARIKVPAPAAGPPEAH